MTQHIILWTITAALAVLGSLFLAVAGRREARDADDWRWSFLIGLALVVLAIACGRFA